MPAYHCQHAGCAAILERSGYCPAHQQDQQHHEAERDRWYDQHARNKEARDFYNSRKWRAISTDIRAEHPVCQRCNLSWSKHVHHIIPLEQCTEAQKYDRANLLAVCIPCHETLEAEARTVNHQPHVTGMLTLAEDDTYRFDAEAAAKPVRFIEKYIVHTASKNLIGTPFILQPIQKQIIGDVYGYKNRVTNLRRINRVWWEAGVGAGKSPLLAAIGVYEVIAGDDPGNEIYCLAADYQQAMVIFDQARAFVKANPILKARCVVNAREIKCKTTGSVWRVVSGKGPKAGMKPGIAFGDEVAQWKHSEAYHDIQGRMAKKPEGLIWLATNATEYTTGIYWELHNTAAEVLSGKKRDDALYPIIWAAPEGAALDDPAAWRAANPLIGVTIREDKIRGELESAKGSPVLEARFRRMYMGLYSAGSNKWLNQDHWKNAAGTIDPATIAKLPLYVGWDGSQGDDLCAALFVWVSPDRFYVSARYWLPESTADHYQRKHAIPYRDWAGQGHVTLIPETTITPAVQDRIAADILAVMKGHAVKAFAYDRKDADRIVSLIEQQYPQKAFPVAQGYSLSRGCVELESRLKANTITVETNHVTDFCAANVEIETNSHGQYWPVKPAQKGKYAGKKQMKIDGIVALVTALTEMKVQEIAAVTPPPVVSAILLTNKRKGFD